MLLHEFTLMTGNSDILLLIINVYHFIFYNVRLRGNLDILFLVMMEQGQKVYAWQKHTVLHIIYFVRVH